MRKYKSKSFTEQNIDRVSKNFISFVNYIPVIFILIIFCTVFNLLNNKTYKDGYSVEEFSKKLYSNLLDDNELIGEIDVKYNNTESTLKMTISFEKIIN